MQNNYIGKHIATMTAAQAFYDLSFYGSSEVRTGRHS
jgi:hypothetical protein